tara:strand:+ start:1817 stop:2191 length:375 start_codon:yes stop_codon:yes gene_type:complete
MALSGFEIAVGGITSIPVTGGLIFLAYKAFGEKNLDASKLKPKKPAQAKKAEPTKGTSESKKVVETKKNTDFKKSAAVEKSATIKKITAEKKPIDSKKSLDVQDSVKLKVNSEDLPLQVPDSKS